MRLPGTNRLPVTGAPALMPCGVLREDFRHWDRRCPGTWILAPKEWVLDVPGAGRMLVALPTWDSWVQHRVACVRSGA